MSGIVYVSRVPLKKTGSQLLSSAVLSLATTFNQVWRLVMVTIKFSGAVTETWSVTLSAPTATYNAVFKTEALTGATSASWIPGNDLIFPKGYEITVGCTKASATATAYCTVLAEAMNSIDA